ncbi:MAG TPA: flagellar biosynthesis regulator FlaF [Xanthobacteraceae bacterium]|nr:flagellar biosynthesis regulator FlaF [Xanthobacteraceae bacterium]
MPLKIELKPNERVILGDCIVTNVGGRTRLQIEGRVPILREKDIMTPRRANSPAGRLYLALQLIYTSKEPRAHYALYLQHAREAVLALPSARPFVDRINNRILRGELYKALKEAQKLIAFEEEQLEMNDASKAYTKVATETASPRELEATLLLKAAAQLQAVHDSWRDKPTGLNAALMYNRRLWTVFLDALVSPDNKLPAQIRDNLVKLGAFVMGETFALMTKPKPNHLKSIIKINRGLAAGLRGRA